MIRLVADSHLSRRFIAACIRLDAQFPIIHVADWLDGEHRESKDPVLLEALREQNLIIVGFDRASMPVHAASLTNSGRGHSGIILFRRGISQVDYGTQSRVLFDFWREASHWDWTDRIEYIPRNL